MDVSWFGESSQVAAFYLAGLLSHPAYRFAGRVIAMFGHVSSITLLLRSSRFARLAVLIMLVLLAGVGLSGCSTVVERQNGDVVSTADNNPVSGLYCVKELDTMSASLKRWVSCAENSLFNSDKCDGTLSHLSATKADYDRCVDKHKSDRIIVNPFNRTAL